MSWLVRPAVWFATASMATTVLHELTHACVAYALGVRSTLFNYAVDVDLTPAQTAGSEPLLIGIAGPTMCLAVGSLAWIAYARARDSRAALPLLFFAVFGMGTFVGNLISASFVGDFSAAAAALDLPMTVRYAISAAGAAGVAAVHFLGGRELVQFAPSDVRRMIGVLGVIVLPVVLGTAAVILVNQPMPSTFVSVRAGEASFWVFAVIGAVLRPEGGWPARASLEPRWADGAALLLAVLVVRILVRGVPLTP